MEHYYKFNPDDYKTDGIRISDGKFFLEILGEWEADFHHRFNPLYANTLLGGYGTMQMIKRCLDLSSNEDCGMELIDDEIDLEKSLAIEKHCKRRTVFAIGSTLQGNFEAPIYLILDYDISKGITILKYNRDDDDETGVPVQPKLVQARV